MKYFRAGLIFTPNKETRSSSWTWTPGKEPYPGKADTHLEAKPYMKFGKAKTGISGKQKDPRPRSERIQIRLAGTTERSVAKAIKASGHQYIVRDRDGHPRGAFATRQEAEARAVKVGGMVFDRIEGRNINRDERRYDIPDPGVEQDEPGQWTVGA
jgi:hypothetical protein